MYMYTTNKQHLHNCFGTICKAIWWSVLWALSVVPPEVSSGTGRYSLRYADAVALGHYWTSGTWCFKTTWREGPFDHFFKRWKWTQTLSIPDMTQNGVQKQKNLWWKRTLLSPLIVKEATCIFVEQITGRWRHERCPTAGDCGFFCVVSWWHQGIHHIPPVWGIPLPPRQVESTTSEGGTHLRPGLPTSVGKLKHPSHRREPPLISDFTDFVNKQFVSNYCTLPETNSEFTPE